MTLTDPTAEHHRAVELHGRDVTKKEYSFGSANTYDDKPRNKTSSTTVRAIIDRSGADVVRDASGTARTQTLQLTVKDSVTVTDSEPPTRFVVDSVKYDTIMARDQNNGVITVTAQRVDED